MEKAGTFALVISFLCPIVGVVCYFVNKDEVENPSAYLISAIGGFVFASIVFSA